ncbi:DUF3800 domain-containing protein [uncultured Caulobacter sp.]|uniref:DUF3800 domain-containing protein n=1 Tax=uncultured Caulobacter sp. TaxID=158749 RepID=UPI00262FD5C6|nr:DUF3800 domain-containing protein [uncultured Caulobacter sp.]
MVVLAVMVRRAGHCGGGVAEMGRWGKGGGISCSDLPIPQAKPIPNLTPNLACWGSTLSRCGCSALLLHMRKPGAKVVYYFCDESSYVTDEFMSVGGLAVPDYNLARIVADLHAIKNSKGGPSETKWNSVKSRRDSAHKAFVDYFRAGLEAGDFHFHVRFAPFSEYDHKISGPKQRIDTTSKMHFQLLLHRAIRFYGKHYKLRIRPDNGDCTSALVDQISKLHTWGATNYGCKHDCIENIEPRDSKREVMLQLLDVPLGAFTALRNQRELIGAKRELADYVQAAFPSVNLKNSTHMEAMKFNVWNVKPSGPRRGPWG